MRDHLEHEVMALIDAPLLERAPEFDAALARALARIETVELREAGPVAPPIVGARSRRMRRTLLIAAAIVIVIASIALASDDVRDALSGDASPARQVDQLRSDEGERVTPEEYDRLVGASVVVAADPGAKGQLASRWALAPIDDSRVIVDDAKVGRVIGAPTADGSTICLGYVPPSGSDPLYGCGIELDAAGVLSAVARSGDARSVDVAWEVYGLAADDVTAVELHLADGTTSVAALRSNGFYWTGRGPDSEPMELFTTRDGRSERADFRGSRVG